MEPEEEREEPKEHSEQNTEPEPNLDPSEHVQESETERVPAQVEPQEPVESVEPLPTAAAAAASSTPVSPGPGAVVEPEGAVLQGEADHHDLQVGGSHQKNTKEEEEKEEDEEEVEVEREEMEGGGALHADKEGGTCEDQTGLNPQQVDSDQTTGDKQKNNSRFFLNISTSRWRRCMFVSTLICSSIYFQRYCNTATWWLLMLNVSLCRPSLCSSTCWLSCSSCSGSGATSAALSAPDGRQQETHLHASSGTNTPSIGSEEKDLMDFNCNIFG